jgi:Mg-chelatase subunit ChlD
MFCLDWSASMMSKDTGAMPLRSRFETCVSCITKILLERIRDCDSVGIVGFGPNVQVVAPPTRKAQGGGNVIMNRLAALRPQMAGGTRFYDAVESCLNLFQQPSYNIAGTQKWLVCLTDGDDAGSARANCHGEMVSKILATSMPSDLNLLVITVGAMKAENIQIINSWAERVSGAGGLGRLLAERDAATIARAFDVVAECLTAEVGGAIEC